MSKKLPAMQFYTGDWLKDTRLLSPAAKGAWIDILVTMWDAPQRGVLVSTAKGIARLIGTDQSHAQQLLNELKEHDICNFEPEGEKIKLVNRRMVRDEQVRKKKAIAGRKGGLKSKTQSKTEAESKQNGSTGDSKTASKKEANRGSSSSSSSSSSNKNNTYNAQFEKFWDLYDNKKGKKRAWKKWKNLPASDQQAIIDHVPIFKTHYSKDYLPYPKTYLYNRYWEDEDFQQPLTEHSNETARQQTGENRTERFIRRGQEVLEEYPDEDA